MMNLSTKNILILATIAVGIFVAGIVFTLTIGLVLAAALPDGPENNALPQPAQKKIPSPMGPYSGPRPTPENRIVPEPLPNLPPRPPVRVAPVPRLELPFQKFRESIEPGEPRRTPGGGLRFDIKAPNERNQGTSLAQAPTKQEQ
jgi:hypothetical protein